ncbi:TBC1 domain family member 4 isoform X1 [Polypterus senegalus]|uniref:TBC1 domain family member 4 isoform X1 n=1 Tax=Polypterus senegalus TaxID=55291 RepID=UPI001964606A|nr:TBC1 domain family member 4 isoform X1 [Polypterus senegalus]
MEQENLQSTEKAGISIKVEKRFRIWYMGWSSLDSRVTMPMLPWLMAEIRRRSEKSEAGATQQREVLLSLTPPLVRCVPATNNSSSSVFIFEHKAHNIFKFIRNSHDLTYFAYLIRTQPDNPESEMACHVFKACDPEQVSEVISSIRQISKAALKEDPKPKEESEDAFYNSQKFEVLFCGKVTVSHKNVPSTVIDDCIEKFRQYEVESKQLKLLNKQKGSAESHVNFLIGDVDPLTSQDDGSLDVQEGDIVSGSPSGTLPSNTSQTSLFGSLGAFPECILEDSGFDDQQEFRTRCNSTAAVMQKKVSDNNLKGGVRRRHASAPSHVQPSDSDKNRTMLFQVGRFEINLISPDTKTAVLEKNFKAISSCSQGIKEVDHFGFICRDASENGTSQYVCYVFQCANEILVNEVMMTLKQAFSTASALQNAKTQIKLCEDCPMHLLHKLCERIEGLYPPRAKLIIQRHLSILNDKEQADIFERVQKMKASSDQEENELVILHLRQLCEAKQKTHVHIGEAPLNAPNTAVPENVGSIGRFKLDILKNKAKKSLTSSLENIFSRGANRMRSRLGSMDSFERSSSLASEKDGSPGESPPATPPASPVSSLGQPFPEEELDSPHFRRRAHTFSHPPSSKKRISFPDSKAQNTRSPLHRQYSVAPELLQSSPSEFSRRTRSVSESDSSSIGRPSSISTPTFLKNIYQGSSRSPTQADGRTLKSNVEERKRSLSGCSGDSVNIGSAPLTPRRVSWRQKIFLRVASPMNKSSAAMQRKDPFDGNELLPLSPVAPALDEDPLLSLLPTNVSSDGQVRKRTSEELRDLWRKAIHQQILLLRMEKENQRLEASRDELQSRKIKLDYQEVGQCPMEVLAIWEKKLSIPSRSKVRFDMEEIYSVLSQGVPKNRRGEIWQFLAAQYRLRHRLPCKQQPPDISYKDLLKQLTAQQHAILVDLGRTFPTHQYFSTQLGAGQLSLFNLLKAYSLLDKEVGYCQGISFVAGVLLLHMSEHQAFEMLKFLMYDLGFRKQYKPDMISLQIQMYQLSRLLHDYHRDLYDHLEGNDITPSLYAAPWFLTLFASQFQLNFVARVFDIIFLQGTEVILKIALSLLSSHESRIMECDGFESIVDFMKNTIPNLTVAHMEKIVAQVFEMDISKQLHAYEVEYHVLHEEMLDSSLPYDSIDRLDKLERTNNQLKRQNMDLLENLQAARAKIQSLEASLDSILSRESKMKQLIRSLEQEKAAYQKTIERMQSYLPTEALSDIELTEFTFSSNSKGKLGNKKP